MLGGILALIGGLASNVIVAAIFGTRAEMDAFLTAMVVPSYIQIIFYSSLYFVLIPAFIDAEVNKSEEDAWALAGTFFWITTIVLFIFAAVGFCFSSSIVNLMAPGFEKEKADMASQMLSVIVFSTPFIGLSTLTTGIQNARNRFFLPSVAPALGYFVNMAVLLALSKQIGAMSLAWGSFASNITQSGLTVIPVLVHGWKRTLPMTHPKVKELGRLMIPLVLFGMVMSISPVADRYFASGLPDGQIAYMGYANKISSIFVVLLASGIAASIFPTMARSYAQDGIRGLSEKNDFGLRLTFAMVLPVLAIVGATAMPLVNILFERGVFTHDDTLAVSRIVFAFLFGDVFLRMVENVLQRSFYVLKDTRTQQVVNFILLILYLLIARFFVVRWGYIGLVWIGVIRHTLGVVILWGLLQKKLLKDNLKSLFWHILKYSASAAVAYLGILFTYPHLLHISVFFQFVLNGLVGLSIYALLLLLMDKDILASLLETVGIQYFFTRFSFKSFELLHRKDQP